MKRFIQFTPLFIRHFQTCEWPFPMHNHNHLELMFIHRGRGLHCLNGIPTPYSGKCLFFLAPNDAHAFDIERETEFSVLKFSYEYLTVPDQKNSAHTWNLLIDELLVAKQNLWPFALSNSALLKMELLFQMIVQEWKENDGKPTAVMLPLIQAVLLLLKSNCSLPSAGPFSAEAPLFLRVVRHIHQYIQQPEKLSIEYLTQHFNSSSSHLSRLFKAAMGLSIKRYIDTYKYQILAHRLQHSRELLKDISAAFGFTDLSHFNKFIKLQSRGLSPKELRRSAREIHRPTFPSAQ
ncbi:helix-turn-helix domain-containing protein [Flavobacterium sp. JP2137]|uniref:helix-turn-helix domain-containing protein n=1 Tax=Flavobacterium sp. JP2137 TaxID=3414510 RepID=UPI003D3007E5